MTSGASVPDYGPYFGDKRRGVRANQLIEQLVKKNQR